MAGNGAEREVHGHERAPQGDTRALRCGYPRLPRWIPQLTCAFALWGKQFGKGC